MSLVEHAKSELARLGNDQDYDDCIIKAVEAFAAYGHSGGSAEYGIEVLTKLLKFENLTGLTNNPDEWMKVSNASWQSRRNPEAFSRDGGNSYYLLSEGGTEMRPYPLHEAEPVFDMMQEKEAGDGPAEA